MSSLLGATGRVGIANRLGQPPVSFLFPALNMFPEHRSPLLPPRSQRDDNPPAPPTASRGEGGPLDLWTGPSEGARVGAYMTAGRGVRNVRRRNEPTPQRKFVLTERAYAPSSNAFAYAALSPTASVRVRGVPFLAVQIASWLLISDRPYRLCACEGSFLGPASPDCTASACQAGAEALLSSGPSKKVPLGGHTARPRSQ